MDTVIRCHDFAVGRKLKPTNVELAANDVELLLSVKTPYPDNPFA
jgi:hypothetical protein